MGKTYGYQYYLAPYRGSVGTMVCAGCSKPIDADLHDFRSAMKSDPDEGWRYVVHHRECLLDQSEFRAEERLRAVQADRKQRLLAACIAFQKEWGIDALDELIAELS